MTVTQDKGSPQFPVDDYYRKYYYNIQKVAKGCMRCSHCKWIDWWEVKNARFAKVCPANHRFLFDAYSCQGKMDISLALLEGRLTYDNSSELLDIFYRCDTCGGCDASCKRVNDAEPLRVMLDMRAKLVQDGQLLIQHMPLIENLRKEDNMMMGRKEDRGKWAEGLDVKDLTKESADVVFHAGCQISHDEERWDVARKAVTILKNAGVDIGIMGQDETCCGCRAYDMGYRGEFTKYAENNIEAWKTARVKTVVTACADGYYAMKRLYPELGSEFEVVHMVEFIDRLIKEGKIKFTKKLPMTVTYHDPCHLGRRMNIYIPGKAIMGIYEEPRDILKAIPGVELAEMYRIKEYAWCCGAGGGVREAYPDFSLWTAGERIEEAKSTGAEAIVTACPWCERNFIDAINDKKEKMKVYDIIELVYQAI
ncbi:(Fe-S)-binding protein [Chloroflexota bacterium]